MPARERLLMDPQWRFCLGDFPAPRLAHHWAKSGNAAWGPLDPAFDDSSWRGVDLPHDFVVEGNFTRRLETGGAGPLNPQDGSARDALHCFHGFLPGGIGWYRRSFPIPASDLGRSLAIEFDGVYRNATVWLNKHYLGTHLSGYTGFRFDITDLVHYGETNTLVVRADATEYEGWFYEGGGIYRHVWLTKTDRLRVAPDGVFVRCDVELRPQGARAAATLRTSIRSDHDAARACRVVSVVRDPSGAAVAQAEAAVTVPSREESTVEQTVEIPAPALWSVDRPQLYSLVTRLVADDGAAVDECTTAFGIRHLRFDPDQGFFLNGEHVLLKGVCCHQDHAGVGSALPDRLQAYRIERLKEMGCNAYRTSHNPPTPELLDACDRLGMLVMDETRLFDSSPEGLAQLTALVRRDRNHPSVILWSLGNEEPLQGTDMGARIAATMKQVIRELDPSRPVTLAMNGAWGLGATHVEDVHGCNYISVGNVDDFHAKFPAKPVVYSESASAVSTRGIYATDAARTYVSAYDVNAPSWGCTAEANWRHCVQRPFVSGTFVWTGFDYRGEPTPYSDWPCINSHFGIMDMCGFPKDSFYYYQAWWSDRTVLHVFPHWNHAGREGQPIDVWAHTNCDRVELFLNGHSLGGRAVERAGHVEWKVPYEPGALRAEGYREGRRVATATVETTGAPAAIRLVPDRARLRADGEDAAVVRVELVDAQGRLVPTAGNRITFAVGEGGRLIGVGNGDPSCHESDKGTFRSAFNGLCQVIVQTTTTAGPFTLSATADGLPAASVTLDAEACVPRPAIPAAADRLRVECSPLLPAVATVSQAAPPPAGTAFAAAVLAHDRQYYDLRPVHGGRDGLVYVRLRFNLAAARPGSIRFGVDGPARVWVNGSEAVTVAAARNPIRRDEYGARAAWQQGENTVLFAVATNGGKAWGLAPRVVIE